MASIVQKSRIVLLTDRCRGGSFYESYETPNKFNISANISERDNSCVAMKFLTS